jgi:hypothetical protein
VTHADVIRLQEAGERCGAYRSAQQFNAAFRWLNRLGSVAATPKIGCVMGEAK